METTGKSKNIIILILVILLIGLSAFVGYKKDSYEEIEALQEAYTKELELYRDEDGILRAKIETLETSSAKVFLAFKTRDSAIIKLQKIVKENTKYLKKQGSVTHMTTNTVIDTAVETKVEYKDSFPIYKGNINLDRWVYGYIVATKDSIYPRLKIRNEFSCIIGREPQGFLGLGKSKSFVDVKVHNPYSNVEELRTYQVKTPKSKRFSVGPYIGVQYYDSSFKPSVGFGVNYAIIKF